jgi:glucan-binding YG repeat protein
MNKKIKRIIALTLTLSAFSVISAITPGTSLNFTTKPVYAASYDPSSEELKSLTIKSTNGDTLDLRDGYNGSTVKLNEDKEYWVKLADDSDGIKINATVTDTDYIVRIFTSDKTDAIGIKPGEEIPLGKGNTTLYVRTYESLSAYRKAKDINNDVTICEEEYAINVKKTTGSSYEDNTQDSIYLENIDINKGNLTFLKQRTSYDIKVDSTVSEIKITAPPEDSDDRVRIYGSLVDSGDNYRKTVSLDNGKNEIKIKVTDDKDNQRTYILNVTRGSSSSSDTQDKIYLDNLSLSEGDIDFSAEDTSYNVKLDETISKVTITAKPEDEEYLVTVNGEELNSGDDYEEKVSLLKGENIVKVVIQDEVNNKKRTYTLTINRGTVEDTKQTDNNTNEKEPGWIQTSDGWKYNDENGNPLKNSWLFDKDAGVYCYLNENGVRKTGWFKDKDKWYLLDTKGAMLTGWQTIDGKVYSLDTNGAMRTGWYREETIVQSNTNSTTTSTNTTNNEKIENWYYLNNDGSMKTGWLFDGGKWYYLNTNGTMQKGWLIYSNSKYYLNADGTMTTGTKTIDGKIYKFTTSGVLII